MEDRAERNRSWTIDGYRDYGSGPLDEGRVEVNVTPYLHGRPVCNSITNGVVFKIFSTI